VRDYRYRRPVHAPVLDQVLDLIVLPGFTRFGDDQDILVADIFIRDAALRIPVLHPAARRETAEQDHLLGIHRLHDDPRDLSQLLLLVLR